MRRAITMGNSAQALHPRRFSLRSITKLIRGILPSALAVMVVVSAPWVCSGLDWSPEELVGGDDDGDDWTPQIEATPDGRVWVVWMGSDPVQHDDEIYYSVRDGDWSARELLHEDNATDDAIPKVTCGEDGIPWVVWKRHTSWGFDLLASFLTTGGWSDPLLVRQGGDTYDMYDILAVDSRDVWVATDAYTEFGFPRSILVYHWDGAAWSEPWQIGSQETTDRGPDVGVDPHGRPWVVWLGKEEEPLGDYLVMCSTLADTGWSAPATVNSDEGNVGEPEIVFDMSGAPIVIWTGNGHVGSDSDVLYSRLEAGEWSAAQLLHEPDGPFDTNIRIACDDSHGEVWVTWDSINVLDPSSADVVASSWLGYGWSPQAAVCDTIGGKRDVYSDLVIVPDGGVWAAWMAYVEIPPFDYDIRASYGIATTAVDFCCLAAEPVAGAVRLSWTAEGPAGGGPFFVWRFATSSDELPAGAVPPADAERLNVLPITSPEWLDDALPAATTCVYWVEWSTDPVERFLGPVHVPIASHTSGEPARLLFSRPNPGRGSSCVAYELWTPGFVELDVYSVSGQGIARVSFGYRSPGRYDGEGELLCWNGATEAGRPVASGVYFVQLRLNGRRVGGGTLPVTLLK